MIETYKSFRHFTPGDVHLSVKENLYRLKYKLIRPHDLDSLLGIYPGVLQRFFRVQTVVDTESVRQALHEQEKKLNELLGRMPGAVSDADLATIQSRITSVPEEFRASVGLGKLFGYPISFYTEPARLQEILKLLGVAKGSIDQLFTTWLMHETFRLAQQVCDTREVTVTVHPFARQIAANFLGIVAANRIKETEFGAAVGAIMKNAKKEASPLPERHGTDDEILEQIVQLNLKLGKELLCGDYSSYMNPPEVFERKKTMMKFAMQGLRSEAEVEHALRDGLKIMRNPLDEAATELRKLCSQQRTIVLQGLNIFDNQAELERMLDSVRRIDGAKSKG